MNQQVINMKEPKAPVLPNGVNLKEEVSGLKELVSELRDRIAALETTTVRRKPAQRIKVTVLDEYTGETMISASWAEAGKKTGLLAGSLQKALRDSQKEGRDFALFKNQYRITEEFINDN